MNDARVTAADNRDELGKRDAFGVRALLRVADRRGARREEAALADAERRLHSDCDGHRWRSASSSGITPSLHRRTALRRSLFGDALGPRTGFEYRGNAIASVIGVDDGATAILAGGNVAHSASPA